MSYTTVPQNIVYVLKKEKGGLKKCVEHLQSTHGIKAKYDKDSLEISADNNDILELAMEMLERRTRKDTFVVEKELGEKSTVKWTFTGKKAICAKHLFKEEIQTLEKKYKIHHTETTVNKEKCIVVTCSYDNYTDFNEAIDNLKGKMKECVSKKIPVADQKEQKIAKTFAKQSNDKYYCEFKSNELVVWGKDSESCNVAIEAFKKQLPKPKSEEKEEETKEEKNDAPEEQTNESENKNDNDASKDPSKDNIDQQPDFDNMQSGDDSKNSDADFHIQRKPGTMAKYGNIDRYTFDSNGMVVHVYKHSIIDLKDIDAITNAANDRLAHGGGVAYFISKAAGKSMDDECKRYIDKNDKIPISKCYVSQPGKIKCKGIIHAVGPSWSDYKNKIECAHALYNTIWNVLEETKKRSWKTVALPAISSAIFGVPRQLCAEMYVKAFVEFGAKFGGCIEVHFVDLNDEIIDLVRKAHESWVQDPSSLSVQNALSYVGAAGRSDKKPMLVPKSTLKFTGEKMTNYGTKIYTYKVCDRISLKVYNGDLTKVDTVDIVAVPWHNPEGHLMKIYKQILGNKYCKFLKEKSREPDYSVLIYRTSKGYPDVATIVMQPKTGSSNITKAVRSLLEHQYVRDKSIALPLLCQVGQDVTTACENMIEGIKEAASQKTSVYEVHIVNFDGTNMHSILTVLKQKTFSSTKNYASAPEWSQSGPTLTDSSQGWIKHEPIDDSQSQDVTLSTKSVSSKSDSMKAIPSGTKCFYHSDKDAMIVLDCGEHGLCKPCQVGKPEAKCLECKPSSNGNSGTTKHQCPVCLEDKPNPKILKCQHVLCDDCYEKVMKSKPQCPQCSLVLGVIKGNQPPGDMFYRFDESTQLPGFEEELCGTIEIWYQFPGGLQQANHPNPGKGYESTQRRAFLPNNAEGKEILHLLRIAFDRKLIFTIGQSTSTGKEGVITWNDIHHKTKIDGDKHGYGYPDPTYLRRVREELEAKGVTAKKKVNKLYPDLSGFK